MFHGVSGIRTFASSPTIREKCHPYIKHPHCMVPKKYNPPIQNHGFWLFSMNGGRDDVQPLRLPGHSWFKAASALYLSSVSAAASSDGNVRSGDPVSSPRIWGTDRSLGFIFRSCRIRFLASCPITALWLIHSSAVENIRKNTVWC